jgi:pimeloyl-ACP methyl ester carboxylesterase
VGNSILALVSACLALTIGTSAGAQQMIDVSGRQFILECAGPASGPVVMLLPGGGGSVEAWTRVKEGAAKFARVCSYEPAGNAHRGDSGILVMDQMAADLDQVLNKVAGSVPTILVGHSAGGLLARRFATQFPQRVVGIVLLDSSHEEQIWRLAAIAPSLLDFGFGKSWKDPAALRAMGMVPAGQRSTWHTDRPLIVIEHGMAEPPPPSAHVSPADEKRLEAAWHAMQQDLAARSPRGQLRTAAGSGTEIHRQKPELVIAAIRDVLAQAR